MLKDTHTVIQTNVERWNWKFIKVQKYVFILWEVYIMFTVKSLRGRFFASVHWRKPLYAEWVL